MNKKMPYIFHVGFNKSGTKSLHAALLLNLPRPNIPFPFVNSTIDFKK